MTPDSLNACFELAAAAFLFLHARRVWTDREVAGVSIAAACFFASWTLFGFFYFASIGHWVSFVCGFPPMVMYLAWIAGLVRFRSGRSNWARLTTDERKAFLRGESTALMDGGRYPTGKTIDGSFPTGRSWVVEKQTAGGHPEPQFRFNAAAFSTLEELRARCPEAFDFMCEHRERIQEVFDADRKKDS